MKPLPVLAIMLMATLCITSVSSNPANAADMPNILIMGEDADDDTVPRNSRVFKRVLNGLSNELHDEGFNVYDETAVTMDHSTQGRTRRVDQEVIDVARSVKRPPIDVATIFSIYARSEKKAYTRKIYTRIEGRLLNVQTGQRLGNFEVELPQPDNVKRDCNRECILETVGKNDKVLAQDLGAVLTIKLSSLTKNKGFPSATQKSGLPSAFALVFNGFKSEEITRIEEYIVAFSGYKTHRPVRSSMRQTEYWYESESDSARLNRNLRQMLDHLGVKGRVTFAGSNFKVEKIGLR